MKAVWQGSIEFGLVNIPVKLYSAAQPKAFKFRLLCGKCHSPLRYKRYCERCKKEIAWQNVVKGIELEKGKFYVLTKEAIQKLKPMKTDVIEIIAFIDPNLIDTIFFASNYYVVPSQKKEKAYFLFVEVLRASAKAAIAKLTMHEKDYIVLIRAYKRGLLLTTLHYPYEIRNIDELEELKEKPEISKKELQLASILLASLTKKEINLEEFRDTFAERLKKALLGKLKIEEEKPRPEKLLEALQLSVKKKLKK